MGWSLDDVLVGDLQRKESVEGECVQTFCVALHLLLGAMKPISHDLDNERRPRKSKIDANDSISAGAEHRLAVRSRETSRFDQPEKLTFQPTVSAELSISFVQHGDHLLDPESTAGVQLGGAFAQRGLGNPPISKRRLHRRGQLRHRLVASQIDRDSGRSHRDEAVRSHWSESGNTLVV